VSRWNNTVETESSAAESQVKGPILANKKHNGTVSFTLKKNSAFT
jgi:hypothetical protein